jgi:hypothetical protein
MGNNKSVMHILGMILILAGTVFFLQGINIIPGSFMTGQREWALYGGISILAGILLVYIYRNRQ